MSCFFKITYFCPIIGVGHCASNFMCLHFFKQNFKFKWPYRACSVHCSYVRNKRSNAIWGLSAFCTPICLFLWGNVLICAHNFRMQKKTRSLRAWCADNIFISYHYPVSRSRNSFLAARSSLLSRSCLLTDTRGSFLISRWLMLADRLLFCISRHLLAAFRLFFFTRWSAGRCRALAPCWSLLVTRFSWHFKLLACRCPLIAVSYLGYRLFFLLKGLQLGPSGSLCRAQSLIGTSKPSYMIYIMNLVKNLVRVKRYLFRKSQIFFFVNLQKWREKNVEGPLLFKIMQKWSKVIHFFTTKKRFSPKKVSLFILLISNIFIKNDTKGPFRGTILEICLKFLFI